MAAFRLKERLCRLKVINQSLLILENQIDYALMSIPDCFDKISQSFEQIYIKNFYKNLSNRLQIEGSCSFGDIWKTYVIKYLKGEFLSQNDCEVIGLVGDMPLYLNKDIQLSIIKLCRKQLDVLIFSVEKDCRSRCKIYEIFGLAAGIMIFLLLV